MATLTDADAQRIADLRWPGVHAVERVHDDLWVVTLGYDGGPAHAFDRHGRPCCHDVCAILADEQDADADARAARQVGHSARQAGAGTTISSHDDD